MRKLAIGLTLTAVFAGAAPAAQANNPARRAARAACRAERQQIGVQAFRQKYGAPNPMARCIAAHGGNVPPTPRPRPHPRPHPHPHPGGGDNQGGDHQGGRGGGNGGD